jgi:Flp pilus assembly protein CpaB
MGRPSLGGLVASRQGALTLALLCAVSAAGILVFALGKYKSGLKTTVQQATVLVATANIAKNTPGDTIAAQHLYKSTPIVASQLGVGAISDAGMLAGRTASVNILPGQQLTQADFSYVGGVTSLLTPNQRAISLSVDEAHGNTDVLQPGDRVDVYAAFNQSNSNVKVVLLAPNALVIKPASGAAASGSTPNTPGKSALTGGSLVMSVSSGEAPEVITAAQAGVVYLALRPANGTVSPRPLTTVQSVIKASVASTAGPASNSSSNNSGSSTSSNSSTPTHH